MLLMVTNRRKKNGQYGDQEMPNKKFEYLYNHKNGPHGQDGFNKTGKKGFETRLLAELQRLKDEEGINTPKVGIYVHGFNNHYQDSIDELFDIEKHLTMAIGYAPVVVGFSWPSSGKIVNYLSDREEARDSVGAFTRFLLDINDLANQNQHDCFSTTFCIAHSMGNYLLRKGMEYLSDYLGTPVGRLLFNETVMLAPDLASGDIEINGKARYIADFSRRVHVYYSRYDRALKASSVKRFGGNRLGRHGANDYDNLPGNVVVVNAENYANKDAILGYLGRQEEQVSVHGSHRYHENILADIEQVLSSIDRDHITGRELVGTDDTAGDLRNHYRLA